MNDDDVNISTREKPGDYDAFETAKPGEPIFVLQGGDPLGPLCVIVWAWKARKLAREMDEQGHAEEADRLRKKANSAEQVAWEMRDYQRGESAVPGERATYVEQHAPASAQGTTRTEIRRQLIGGVHVLNNALGTSNDFRERLAALDAEAVASAGASDAPAALGMIAQAVELLRGASAKIEPRRGRDRT